MYKNTHVYRLYVHVRLHVCVFVCVCVCVCVCVRSYNINIPRVSHVCAVLVVGDLYCIYNSTYIRSVLCPYYG